MTNSFSVSADLPPAPAKVTAYVRTGYFVIAGLNSFATTLYLFYLYFFLPHEFGFSNKQNLLCAAMGGCVYMFSSWYAGRWGQKHGYDRAMRLGFILMAASLVYGAVSHSAAGQVLVLASYTVAMSFTWPALEGTISEPETRATLPKIIGIYNLVWAGTSALAYFTGGAMQEKFGERSFIIIPAAIHLVEVGILYWCCKPKGTGGLDVFEPLAPSEDQENERSENFLEFEEEQTHAHPLAKAFLRMAWLANPFAYVAINSLIPMIPSLAEKLELSPMFAGFFCSIWLFARLGAFGALWLWTGWHYRLRWLVTAYLAMVGCFVILLVAPQLWLVIGAQAIFGLAIGLIYYSSLYYSLDIGETKGEHGGLHEAAIGLGNFSGPMMSAAALQLFPGSVQSGTWSVGGLLVMGLTTLVWLGWRSKRNPEPCYAIGTKQ